MAHSRHWFRRRACPLLAVKRTSLVRDWMAVNDPRVDLEENRHVFLVLDPSLLTRLVSLLPPIGEKVDLKPHSGCKDGFVLDVKALSLQLGQITLQFPRLAG